jgi:hypothetical protein
LYTILLWIFSILMPALVALSDSCTGYWQKSQEHLRTVRKQLGYLLLMVIVLPLTVLTSLRGIVEAIILESKGIPAFIWGCIYIPDGGAFYINYVITGTFIGGGCQALANSRAFDLPRQDQHVPQQSRSGIGPSESSIRIRIRKQPLTDVVDLRCHHHLPVITP